MIISHAKTSTPGAKELRRCIEEVGSHYNYDVELVMSNRANINWGRSGEITMEGMFGDERALNHNISCSTDKLEMRLCFIEHNVPTPTLFDDYEDACEHIRHGGTVLARTRTHTRRKGFWRCNTHSELDTAILGGAVQFIEYITDVVREYRVHIFRGTSIRLNQKQWTNTACTKYTTIPANKIDYPAEVKAVRRAAKDAVAAIGLDFGAVDVIVPADGQPLVCEVNAAPGLGGTTGMAYATAIITWWENP